MYLKLQNFNLKKKTFPLKFPSATSTNPQKLSNHPYVPLYLQKKFFFLPNQNFFFSPTKIFFFLSSWTTGRLHLPLLRPRRHACKLPHRPQSSTRYLYQRLQEQSIGEPHASGLCTITRNCSAEWEAQVVCFGSRFVCVKNRSDQVCNQLIENIFFIYLFIIYLFIISIYFYNKKKIENNFFY